MTISCVSVWSQDSPAQNSFNRLPILTLSAIKQEDDIIDIESEEVDVENSEPSCVEQQKRRSESLPSPAKKQCLRTAEPRFGLLTTNKDLSLPVPLALPKEYSPKITAALARKKMTYLDLSKFITAIAKLVFTFKSYPTRDELTQVATQLIDEYPFIRSTAGVSCVRVCLV